MRDLPPIICENPECTTGPFVPTSPKQKACKEACRNRAWKLRRRAGFSSTTPELITTDAFRLCGRVMAQAGAISLDAQNRQRRLEAGAMAFDAHLIAAELTRYSHLPGVALLLCAFDEGRRSASRSAEPAPPTVSFPIGSTFEIHNERSGRPGTTGVIVGPAIGFDAQARIDGQPDEACVFFDDIRQALPWERYSRGGVAHTRRAGDGQRVAVCGTDLEAAEWLPSAHHVADCKNCLQWRTSATTKGARTAAQKVTAEHQSDS